MQEKISKNNLKQDFDAVEYLNSPDWRSSKPGLYRIKKLMNLLGNPQKSCKFVHVAGTNGKGSVCAYLSEIFIAAGIKTGKFTSPFIWNFSERIQINNQQISKEDLTEVTLRVKDAADSFPKTNHPTEFELMTAVAFCYFAHMKCDVVVLEVGMGGRLDSTNVVTKDEVLCSVITRIGLDHTSYLGSTTEEVAREKAGILKDNIPAVVWPQDCVINACRKQSEHSEIVLPDFESLSLCKVNAGNRQFLYKGESFSTSLLAKYQPYNAALAIETARLLERKKLLNITEQHIKSGVKTTRWPVRFEIVSDEPTVIIDGGHNPQGAEALAESLQDVFPGKKVVFIMGVLADKDYKKMVKTVTPLADNVLTITPSNPRALSAEKLVEEFKGNGVRAIACSSFEDAVERAKNNISEEESKKDLKNEKIICCFGSLYSAASLYNLF